MVQARHVQSLRTPFGAIKPLDADNFDAERVPLRSISIWAAALSHSREQKVAEVLATSAKVGRPSNARESPEEGMPISALRKEGR